MTGHTGMQEKIGPEKRKHAQKAEERKLLEEVRGVKNATRLTAIRRPVPEDAEYDEEAICRTTCCQRNARKKTPDETGAGIMDNEPEEGPDER